MAKAAEERARALGVIPGRPQFWANPGLRPASEGLAAAPTPAVAVTAARDEWDRLGPLLVALFPELTASRGRIGSGLIDLPPGPGLPLPPDVATLLVKADHALPVTGTIKARGGLFAVLRHAQALARRAGLLPEGADSAAIATLAGPQARDLFGRHRVVTGSTGNLGYSVGLAATALGFTAEVHMSAEARPWKVARLEALGVQVIRHAGDFSAAIAAARQSCAGHDDTHFVDDENSLDLFLGYAAAAYELQAQLAGRGLAISDRRPLVVYLPSGVGGAPGGVTFGLKALFGDAVHCVLVEPVAAPAMLAQVAFGAGQPVSARDLGLDNRTVADGLAVAQASMLAVRHVAGLVQGIATVSDAALLDWTRALWHGAGLRLEPSAAAGFAALPLVAASPARPAHFREAVHVVWTTGGSRLPDAEFLAHLSAATDSPAAAPTTPPQEVS